MKIGILQCDDVMQELQPEFGNYPGMIEALLSKFASEWEFVTYRAVDSELPDSVHACDGYITTGSRYGVNDDLDWLGQLEEYIGALVKADKKFVGICFGHQLLGKVMGGKVEPSDQGWGVGVSFNQLMVKKPWMEPYQSSLDLVVSHLDQITQLPQGAEVLVSSRFCPYYMLQYGRHLMSVQGHPEFSKPYSSALMAQRTDRIPASRGREGQASLAAKVDDHLMSRWIVNFFAGVGEHS